MHLALLMTNTDESAFAQGHPKDGEKFTDLVHLVRPAWTTDVFSVKDGVFPDTLDGFDGIMITGSPASVHDPQDWVDRLLDLIREAADRRLPMFGACFGHQAIALALGGGIGRNPGGWVHGLTRNQMLVRPEWASDLPDVLKLYGSHVEQVTELPDGGVAISRSEGCDISGFMLGHTIYTTQHHPEMTAGFIAALTEELADDMGADLYEKAKGSLTEPSDMEVFAESVARFFEQAVSRAQPANP